MKKIFLSGCSSSAALTERGLKYFFRLCPTDRTESQEFVEYFEQMNKELKAASRPPA